MLDVAYGEATFLTPIGGRQCAAVVIAPCAGRFPAALVLDILVFLDITLAVVGLAAQVKVEPHLAVDQSRGPGELLQCMPFGPGIAWEKDAAVDSIHGGLQGVEGRAPNSAVPMRTMVAPSAMASA